MADHLCERDAGGARMDRHGAGIVAEPFVGGVAPAHGAARIDGEDHQVGERPRAEVRVREQQPVLGRQARTDARGRASPGRAVRLNAGPLLSGRPAGGRGGLGPKFGGVRPGADHQRRGHGARGGNGRQAHDHRPRPPAPAVAGALENSVVVEGLHHARRQIAGLELGDRRCERLPDPLELREPPAGRRGVRQPGLDAGLLRRGDLPFEVGGEHVRRTSHRSSSVWRSFSSASNSRRFTVPTGTPSASAISS
jgi:hypothetical protein